MKPQYLRRNGYAMTTTLIFAMRIHPFFVRNGSYALLFRITRPRPQRVSPMLAIYGNSFAPTVDVTNLGSGNWLVKMIKTIPIDANIIPIVLSLLKLQHPF